MTKILPTRSLSSKVADCLPGLVDGAARDPDIRRLHHRYNARRRAALVEAIAEGRSSGEPGFDVDPDLAALALAGAVIYRRLMTADPLTAEEVVPLVETVLRPTGKARSSRGSAVSDLEAASGRVRLQPNDDVQS